jgi:IS4 transposase
MSKRVDVGELLEFQWPYLMAFLGGRERVTELAYQTGAFYRQRKIGSPDVLLQLLLNWAAGEQSLMDTAALAADAGWADVSDVALLKRFHKCGDWLGALLGEILIDRQSDLPANLRLRVLDASALARPGNKGTDHRLHLGIDLGSNLIESIELTSVRGGESLDRFSFRPEEVVLADAGYAQRAGLAKVARSGAFFVIRFPWSNLPLETDDGEKFSLLESLRTLPEAEAGEFAVYFRAPDGERIAVRVVAIRKSEAAAAAARKKALRQRTKNGEKITVQTLEAAGFIFLLTNLPESISTDSVLQLYRFRWQVEIKFKVLKSVIHLDQIPARTDEGLRVYVSAKLLIALLIESLIHQAESFSPWGYPIAADQRLAPHQTAP